MDTQKYFTTYNINLSKLQLLGRQCLYQQLRKLIW